jgi:hypothetical protein
MAEKKILAEEKFMAKKNPGRRKFHGRKKNLAEENFMAEKNPGRGKYHGRKENPGRGKFQDKKKILAERKKGKKRTIVLFLSGRLMLSTTRIQKWLQPRALGPLERCLNRFLHMLLSLTIQFILKKYR